MHSKRYGFFDERGSPNGLVAEVTTLIQNLQA